MDWEPDDLKPLDDLTRDAPEGDPLPTDRNGRQRWVRRTLSDLLRAIVNAGPWGPRRAREVKGSGPLQARPGVTNGGAFAVASRYLLCHSCS